MKFGEKLSFLRKQNGMTQMELAEKLDISRQAVSRWEQEMSEPSTENLVSIGKLFGVSIDDLVNEAVQIQTEATVQVAVAEEGGTEKKHSRYSILIIVGTMLFVVVTVLAVCIGLKKGQQELVPMEDFSKDAVNVSQAVALPLEPLD